MKTCIIGVSGYGKNHYNALMDEVEKKEMEAVAAAVINQDEEVEKCARLKELGCELFEDYGEMLEEYQGVAELCMIPTGIPLHRPMTEAALSAGMHVFVEKPVAGAIQDARAMIGAAKEAGKVVAVGYQDMYMPNALPTKRDILAGKIGSLKCVKGWAKWPRTDEYYARNNWAGKLKVDDTYVLDSPYNNALAHELIMMLFLAGGEEQRAACPVRVEAELYRAHDIESADTVCMRIETDTGIPVYFFVTHSSEEMAGSVLEVHGEGGRISWTRHGGTVIDDVEGKTRRYATLQGEERYVRIMGILRDAIDGGDVFYSDLELSSMQTLAVNGAHEASKIHAISPEHIERFPEDDSMKTVVKGLSDAIDRGFAEEKLFSELGDVPWAKEKGSFDLKGYKEFNGGK